MNECNSSLRREKMVDRGERDSCGKLFNFRKEG